MLHHVLCSSVGSPGEWAKISTELARVQLVAEDAKQQAAAADSKASYAEKHADQTRHLLFVASHTTQLHADIGQVCVGFGHPAAHDMCRLQQFLRMDQCSFGTVWLLRCCMRLANSGVLSHPCRSTTGRFSPTPDSCFLFQSCGTTTTGCKLWLTPSRGPSQWLRLQASHTGL